MVKILCLNTDCKNNNYNGCRIKGVLKLDGDAKCLYREPESDGARQYACDRCAKFTSIDSGRTQEDGSWYCDYCDRNY